MKKLIAIAMIFVCLLSLAACGQKEPSLEEVSQAIEAGSLTLEDALAKGWITQEWADEYIAERSVPASDKMDANAVAAFSTTTLSGEEFTQADLSEVTFLVFLDPSDENAEAFFTALKEGYEGVAEAGAGIVVCTKSETGNEIFADAPFPVVFYNDSVKEATANNSEMIEGLPCAASWYVNGAFLSAWYSMANAEELPKTASAFVEMSKDMGSADGAAAMIG